MQNLYETLLIVAPEADDDRVNAVIGDLRATVENDGGTVLQAGVWERRKLAYQVKGKSEGIYVLMYADGNNTLPAALRDRMKLDESVIRSMVVRLEDLQEADLRQKIAEADHSGEAAEIEAQRVAAERRHEAEAAASAMSLEEIVAAQEAQAVEAEGAAGADAAEPGIEADEAETSPAEAPADTPPADEATSEGVGESAEPSAGTEEPRDEEEKES